MTKVSGLIDKPAKEQGASSVLTKRERDVVRAVAEGMSNKEIADHLGIGANTVRTHISNILRKLNLSNRTQLALHTKDEAGEW